MAAPGFSCLPWPEKITPEAFDDGPLRVPLQIAAVLGMSLEDVQMAFADVYESLDWSGTLSSEDVFKLAEQLGISCYHFSPRLVKKVVIENRDHGKSLVFASWGNWLYFYRDAGNLARKRCPRAVRRGPRQKPPPLQGYDRGFQLAPGRRHLTDS